jgi:hypothetical protein
MKSKAISTITTMPYGEGSTTVRLSNADKIELLKIGARLLLKDGEDRTMEEIMHIVIAEYKKLHKIEDRE